MLYVYLKNIYFNQSMYNFSSGTSMYVYVTYSNYYFSNYLNLFRVRHPCNNILTFKEQTCFRNSFGIISIFENPLVKEIMGKIMIPQNRTHRLCECKSQEPKQAYIGNGCVHLKLRIWLSSDKVIPSCYVAS